jgi:maltooligosyltrehalose trehalohydrolase
VAATLLSPSIPLLFMGEEYAATTPFPYFVDHGDPDLLEAVRKGRAAEFGRDADQFDSDPFDPGAEASYLAAKLDRGGRETPEGAQMLAMVRRLIELRRSLPLLTDPAAETVAELADGVLTVRRRRNDEEITVTLSFTSPFDFSVCTADGVLA